MPGIPVVIIDKYGIPVRQVTSGAPLMTVAANGRGIPIVLSTKGMAFVVEGANPVAPNAFTSGQWTFARTGTSGELAVGIISTPSGTTNVKYRLDGGSWVSRGNTLSFNLTGLTNGTEYDLELMASNITGDSAVSDLKSATPATVPAALVLTATPADGGMVLTNAAPAANGSAITDYVYEYKLDSEPTTWTTWPDGTSSTPGAVITGLTNDVGYDFRGFAINAVGSSLASNIETDTPSAAVGIVEITPNDALSRFEISNTASFPGGTWTWYDDDNAQVGTVTTPYLLYSAVPGGELIKARANGNAATDSILWAVPNDYIVFGEDFSSVANGTDFVGRQGWTGPAGKLEYNAGHVRVKSDISYPNIFFLRDVPYVNQSFEMTVDFNSSGGGSGNDGTRQRELFLHRSDELNWVKLTIFGNGAYISKRVAGTVTDLALNLGGGNSGSHKFNAVTQVIDSVIYMQAYKNDVRIDGDGPGIACTGVPPSPKLGFTFGGGTDPSNPSFPFNLFSSIKLASVPDVGITMTDFSFSEPTDIVPPSIQIVGETSYTAIQAIWFSEDGEQYGPITDLAGLTPGDYALTVPTPPEATGKNGYLRLRETANPANYLDSNLGFVPFFDAVDPLEFGINIGGTTSYSAADIVKDRGRVISWRYRNGGDLPSIPESDLNAEGWPIAMAIPAPYTERVAIIFENPPPGIRTGTWNVTVNTPTTGGVITDLLENLTLSGVTTTTCTLTTIDPAVSQKAWLRFPSTVTIPPEGLQVSCVLASETVDANVVTPALASIYSAAAFNSDRISIRTMKPGGSDTPAGGASAAVLPQFAGRKEWAADATHRLGADIHFCAPWADVAIRPSTTIEPYMAHFMAHALSTSILAGSIGNEVWNWGYNVQRAFMAAGGFSEQLVPAVGVPVGKTVTNEEYGDQNLTGAVNPGGLTRRTINPGEWFFAVIGTHRLVECVSATPVASGYTIPDAGDTKFAIRGNFEQCQLAARRYQGWLQKKLRVAGRAIMGDRFVSTYECFLSDTPQDIANLLLFDNTWEGVDEISPSFYCGAAMEYGSLAWHSQHTSNFAAFKAGYLARWAATWTDTLNQLIAIKHGVPSILLANGVPVDRLPRMRRLYEGGDHNTITNVPSDQREGLRLAIIAVLNSVEGAAQTGSIWGDMKTYLGGPMEWFCDVEKTFYNGGIYPNGQMQSFGLREYQFNGSWNSSGTNEGRYNATVAAFT